MPCKGGLGCLAQAVVRLVAQHTIGIVVRRPRWLGTQAKLSKGVGGGQHMAATIRTKGWSVWFDEDQRALKQTNRCVCELICTHKGESAWDVAQDRLPTYLGRLWLDHMGLPGRS